MKNIRETLLNLQKNSNLRRIPDDTLSGTLVDLSGNDYLGLAENKRLAREFMDDIDILVSRPGSSASRLLSASQNDYAALEKALADAYGRAALLFNSGFHANIGIIRALADKSTLFVADKLVHASIIDGMNLATTAGARFVRFRHNDFDHLRRIMETQSRGFERVVIVAESVYSMDGDRTDLDALIDAKSLHPNTFIYLDEAHSVGVLGEAGLGMAVSHPGYNKIDIVVGTFGKAFASMGAYAVTSPLLREFLVNRCRSLIFSTALPPLTARWSLTTFRHALGADTEREHLAKLAVQLTDILPSTDGNPRRPSHIQPYIVGTPEKAIAMANRLRDNGFKVLPIRTPTVPAGTDRLRFSLSAALTISELQPLRNIF